MKIWIHILALASLAATPLAAQVYPLSENTWSNPGFVKRFLGSYGVASEVEPTISAEEQALFREVIPLISGNPREAIRRLRAETTANASAALDYTLANLYAQTGNPAEARRYYESAIRKYPDFRRAYRNLGLVLVQAGSYEAAPPHLVKALELGAEDGLVYGMLGYAYLNRDKPESALEAYGKALLLDPDNPDWRQGKVEALSRAGRHEETIAQVSEMLAEKPGQAKWWLLQANAFLALEQTEKAAENLEIVRRMNAATGRSLALLGDIYTNRNLHGLALDAYLEALELGNGELGAGRMLGAAEALANRAAYTEAERLAKAVRLRYADSLTGVRQVRLLNLEAAIALNQGRDAEAAAKLRGVVEREPLNGRALLLLADYELEQENFEQAAFYYERAAKLDEYRADALVEHARMRVEMQQYARAAELLREAQLVEPRENVAAYLEAVERTARAAEAF